MSLKKTNVNHIIILYLLVCFTRVSAQVSDFKSIDFTKTDNIVALHNGESLNNLPLLVYKLKDNLVTDIEKFRAIYTWVCYNISGDANQHNTVSSKQHKFKNDSLGYIEWNERYKKIAFKKLLKHKKTMCTGYAYLIKEMCFIANIECEIINGYGRSFESNIEQLKTLNHSWNSVKINDKWYLCDATWSSGYMINKTLFIKDYNDGYFLTDPILFSKNHYPVNKKWFLNDSLANTRFVAEPIIYGETFKQNIIPITPNTLHTTVTKNEVINFSFKSLKTIATNMISLIKVSKNNHIPYKIYDLKNKNGVITFKYNFKSKGRYDIHLKIGDDIVATYAIKVSKT